MKLLLFWARRRADRPVIVNPTAPGYEAVRGSLPDGCRDYIATVRPAGGDPDTPTITVTADGYELSWCSGFAEFDRAGRLVFEGWNVDQWRRAGPP